MKPQTSRLILALAGMAMFLGACGDPGTQQYPGLSAYYGFRVLQTDPLFNQEMVDLNKTIQIQFSEAIDPNSIQGAYQMTEITTGNVAKDITAETAATAVAPNLVSIIVTRQLVYGARYSVTLSPTVRSVSGRPLQQFVLPFSTGSNGDIGLGAVSVAGSPTVKRIQVFQSQGVCLGFTIEFNEDLAQLPYVDGQQCPFHNCSGPTTPLFGSNFYNNNSRIFVFTFPDFGCDCSYYSADMRVKVIVRDAVDLQGERLAGETWEKFDALSGFLSSDYRNACY